MEEIKMTKRSVLGSYLFYMILVLVTTGITVLIMFLMSGEETKSKMLTEYEAERTAALVVEEFFEGKLDNPQSVDSRVHGFGIYNPNGEKMYAWGSVPRSYTLPEDRPERRLFLYSDDGNRLTLIRPIGNPRMARRMFRRFSMGQAPPPPPPIVYMVFDASGHGERSRSISLAVRLIPFITSISMIVIAVLYARNVQYRKKLLTQSELEKLGEIARTLAHEIKNPLGAMQIHTGYLKKILPAEMRGELGILEEEISRLNLLTHRISDFVRDPVGTPEEMELAPFIADIAKRYKSKVLFADGADSPYIVRFDKERLRSVLDNLITNGIESYEDSGTASEPLVEISLSQEKGKTIICIEDRGIGIKPGTKDKMYDPFFSTKTTGSGIGLAITKRFVEAAGCEIGLVPREGGGTIAKIVCHKEARG
jgi:two-component system, NtrC family, sensor histidine kinase HydH